MLKYQKISKLNRTIIGTLLLLVFMALVMADAYASFFGGIIFGALMLQLFFEGRMFLRTQRKRNT